MVLEGWPCTGRTTVVPLRTAGTISSREDGCRASRAKLFRLCGHAGTGAGGRVEILFAFLCPFLHSRSLICKSIQSRPIRTPVRALAAAVLGFLFRLAGWSLRGDLLGNPQSLSSTEPWQFGFAAPRCLAVSIVGGSSALNLDLNLRSFFRRPQRGPGWSGHAFFDELSRSVTAGMMDCRCAKPQTSHPTGYRPSLADSHTQHTQQY